MTDEEFLKKAKEHIDYDRLLQYQPSPEELDKAILRIKNGEGVSKTYYEYSFVVESNPLENDRSKDFKDFLKDLSDVFDKYEGKGIIENGMDSKGGSSPMALDIVKDILKENPS